MKEGIREGKKEGELQEKKNTVLRIIKSGSNDVDLIMRATGLGKDEVLAIIKDIG